MNIFNKILSLFGDVKKTKKQHEDNLIARENVCGVGVKDNQIIVLVEKKLPLDHLRPVDVVPTDIDGFETKVIEVGEITASTVSGCPITGTACSIAGICKKGNDTFYLSNSHCKFSSVGKAYLSPSPWDGGNSSNKVGTVFDQSTLSGAGEFKVDAMIAKTDNVQDVTLETDKAITGDLLEFEGRTSGKQKLRVIADDVTINVGYDGFVGRMTNQIMLEGIVRGGDSGSGLMKNGKICGLIFASNNINYGFANHIQNVIDEMGIEFKTTKVWKYFKPSETTGFKDFGVMGTIADLKPEFVDMLDKARDLAGVPFVINSGYRMPAYNKSVGGTDESAHQTREAVDIRCRNSNERFKIKQALYAVGFKRIGHGKTFIHADISKTLPQEREWDY